MKLLLRVVSPALLLMGAAQAQPRITSLVNSASYIAPPLPGSSIAQGSLFVVFGSNMGPAALEQSGLPLPTELSGTQVRISASGNNVSAFMVYTSAGQLAGILPSDTPIGPAVARVTYNGQTSEPFSFTVVRSSPGLYTLNSGGSGPAVLTTPDFQVITYNRAATDGDVLSAWVTGITPLSGRPDNQAAEFFDPPLEVEVFVGGRRANVRYRGRAPGLAGLDQVVFDLPASLRGCNIPLAIRVGGVISNYTTMAVGDSSRRCADAHGLPADVGTATGLRLGVIGLARTRTKIQASGLTAETRSDLAFADFTRFDANSFIRSQGVGAVSLGQCIVSTFSGEGGAPDDPFAASKLDAGPQLTLTGPGGTRQITREASGSYLATLGSSTVIPGFPSPGPSTAFLEPGTYTVTGPGGADVGAFSTRITVPQPLTTNLDSITTVSRGAALNVTWQGGAANEYIFVSGSSFRQNPSVGAVFTCTERASVGRLQVPAEVLLALPPSQTISGAPTGSLSVSSAPLNDVARFTASGLDLGILSYTTAESKNVPYE